MAAKSWIFKQVFAMIMILLVSLASAEVDPSIYHISKFMQGRTSRRVLLQRLDRQAPRSFPPPQGNAFLNNPRHLSPPGRPFFDAPDGRPAAWLPENARRLVPPLHP